LAISKERKNEVVAQYEAWANRSRAFFLAEYKGLSMKQLDELRTKIRDAGGEFHVVKNTLGTIAFQSAGIRVPEGFFEGSTAVGFAFGDVAALAQTMSEYARTSDFLKIKGGFLDKAPITADQVKALADLPPLPVIRAQLLGTLLAPASQLARIIAEPARQVAAVLKAYAEKDAASTTAPEAA
jgi:large subunit ribosomal protein L10